MNTMRRILDTYWKRIVLGLVVIVLGVAMRDYLYWALIFVGLGFIVWGLATWEAPTKTKKRKG